MTNSQSNMHNIVILDCESIKSILKSLETIFSTEKHTILEFIRNNDLDDIYERSNQEQFHYILLYDEFRKVFNVNSKTIKANWFHNTRVFKDTCFSEGVLPLRSIIPLIDEKINQIVVNMGLTVSSVNVLNYSTIKHKLITKVDSGPWGFLIKDFALELPNGIHNYLDIPEIVEDIVHHKYPDNYTGIIEKYKELTRPCIVKFKSEEEFHPDNLAYVIYYLYQKEKGLELNRFCNYNHSKCGHLIDPDMILNIEFK